MSSDRNRVIAIFAGVAIVLGGGLFYYTKIYVPGQAKAAAREQVKEWDARWTEARRCLLGGTPASPSTAEALAIHELEAGWDPRACSALIGKLSRGEGESSGIPAIETAWSALESTANKAAQAFAEHVMTGSSWHKDTLPPTLDNLTAARAALGAAVDLPFSGPSAAAALPVAQVVAIDPTVKEIRTEPYLPSALGAMYFGSSADKQLQIELVPGAAPKIERVDAESAACPTRVGPRASRMARFTSAQSTSVA